jgi:arylsulfatase
MAEVYAGFLSHADHHIGRLLDYLEETGKLENMLVIVVSDNGASGEGGPNGSVNEAKFMNGIPDDMQENLRMLDELGGTKTCCTTCTPSWACSSRRSSRPRTFLLVRT